MSDMATSYVFVAISSCFMMGDYLIDVVKMISTQMISRKRNSSGKIKTRESGGGGGGDECACTCGCL